MVVIVVNADTVERAFDVQRMDDILHGQRAASEVPSLKPVQLPNTLVLEPLSFKIYEVRTNRHDK